MLQSVWKNLSLILLHEPMLVRYLKQAPNRNSCVFCLFFVVVVVLHSDCYTLICILTSLHCKENILAKAKANWESVRKIGWETSPKPILKYILSHMNLELSECRAIRFGKGRGQHADNHAGWKAGVKVVEDEMVGDVEEPQVRKEGKKTWLLVTNSDLGCALRAPLPSYRLLSVRFAHDGEQSLQEHV